MRPTVYVCGGTAAGKSSLARDLAEHFGFAPLSASARLVEAMADSGRSRADRLRSWLVREHHIRRNADFDRATDFDLLHRIDAASSGIVVDSGYLSLLLSPVNSAMTIWVDASLPVRAARLAAIVPGVDEAGRELIVRRKDAGTAASVSSAWGIDATRVELWDLRHDLVLCCPEADACSDPGDCAQALREVARQAVYVYLSYCGDAQVGRVDGAAGNEGDGSHRPSMRERAEALRTVCERRGPWVRRISPALLAPADGAGPERWRARTAVADRPTGTDERKRA